MSASEETEAKGIVTVLLTSVPLILIGFGVLAVLMYFSWQFGWSLGKSWWDSVAMGSLHVSAELASAGLVGWSAVIAALGGWAWRRRSFYAFVCAGVFALISVLNTYGFMSPRIAAVAGHEGVVEAQRNNAEWLKQMSVNPETANAVGAAAAECATGRGPKCISAEARAKFLASQQGHMGEKLELQFRRLEKTASENPDSHAIAVASVTGLSVDAALKLIILLMAGFGQCVKFSCTFFGFKGLAAFLHRRRRTIAASPKADSGNGEGSGGKAKSEPETVRQDEKVVNFPAAMKTEPAQLQATPKVSSGPPRVPAPAPSSSLKTGSSIAVHALLDANPGKTWETISDLAREAGVSVPTASREVRKSKGRGKLEKSRKGRGYQVTSKPWKGGSIHAVL